MLLFIESAIRGGVSQCSNKYAKANNRYMESNSDPNLPESYIIYFGINNQFGAPMSEFLPYRNCEWVEDFQSLIF